jgi:hypothetical protein
MTRGPSNHYHPDLWTEVQQHRYEDRVQSELRDLKQAVDKLTVRVTMLLGAIALLVFILPVAAPFIRGFLGLP